MKPTCAWILLFLPVAGTAACHRGPAPPGGTYEVDLSGTRTLTTSETAAPQSVPWAFTTTATVYLDESSSGVPIEYIFEQMLLTAPRRGRLFEMRLFPDIFQEDTSTATMAGVFSDTGVEAVGQAWVGGYDVVATFEGSDQPTFCAYYERYRYLHLAGTWAGDAWDVSLDAVYTETCIDAGGVTVKNGYPEVDYELEGTTQLLFEPEPPAERPATGPSALVLEDTLAEAP